MVFRRVPGRNILNIKNEIDRIYDEMFSNQTDEVESMGNYIPPLNIEETDKGFLIDIELPGVDRNDVKLTFENGTLSISGTKTQVKDKATKTYHRRECEYGSFSRSFSIPSLVQTDKLEAEFVNGVLKIKLPKAEEAVAKEIEINIK